MKTLKLQQVIKPMPLKMVKIQVKLEKKELKDQVNQPSVMLEQQRVGTALDATGVFAPLGALFNLAGLAVEGFTAYEAGKGVVDWVNDDVTYTQTYFCTIKYTRTRGCQSIWHQISGTVAGTDCVCILYIVQVQKVQ